MMSSRNSPHLPVGHRFRVRGKISEKSSRTIEDIGTDVTTDTAETVQLLRK